MQIKEKQKRQMKSGRLEEKPIHTPLQIKGFLVIYLILRTEESAEQKKENHIISQAPKEELVEPLETVKTIVPENIQKEGKLFQTQNQFIFNYVKLDLILIIVLQDIIEVEKHIQKQIQLIGL